MVLDVPEGTPDNGKGMLALCVTTMVLTSLSTIIRIVSKVVVKQYWWWDDFFAIFSLPHFLAMTSIILAWRDVGLGLPAEAVMMVNPLHLLAGGKYLYVAVHLFDCSISYPKLAAICFYARIFRSNNRAFMIHLWVAGTIVSCWLLSALIATVFQCTPIAKAWNPELEGYCIDTYSWYLTTAALSCITDFYILLLPVPMIWALNVSVKRRVRLLLAFFLAYSVIVLSIGRMISTTQIVPTLQLDLTWNMPSYLYWATLEGAVSVISISVPNMVALYKAMFGDPFGASTTNTKHTGPSSKSHGTSTVASRHNAPLSPVSANGATFERLEEGHTRDIRSSGSDSQDELKPKMSADEGPLRMNRIHVRTDIHVQHKNDMK